jgi:hypothetical protein
MKRVACLVMVFGLASGCVAAEPSLPKLLEDLKSEDAFTRYAAVTSLGKLGPKAKTALPELTKLLRSEDVIFREEVARTLQEIAGTDYAPAVDTLAQIDRDNRLVEQVWEGDLDGVKAALKAGASVNGRYLDRHRFLDEGRSGYTPLIAAVLKDEVEIVKLLLDKKPDLEAKRHAKTALFYAVRGEHKEIVTLLKEAGAAEDPKRIELTEAVVLAACEGFEMVAGEPHPLYPGAPRDLSRAEPIEKVIERGGDVNAVSPEGYTPLMFAANLGLTDNVKALLAKGAEVNRKAPHGDTALSLALPARQHLEGLGERVGPADRKEDGGNVRKVYKSPELAAKVEAYAAVIDLLKKAGAKEKE